MTKDETKPNPGSPEAIEQGCKCPRMDNANGKGIVLNGETCFWYSPECSLHIVDATTRTCDLQTLGAHLRSIVRQHGVKVLVIDYIQLLKVERVDRRHRNERIAEASQEVKRLANELDIAIIEVAQFNRDGAKSGKPSMFDLEGSGQLEKDASLVFIIDRDEVIKHHVTLRIVKGRNTGNGEIPGTFRGHCLKFEF